MPLVPTFDFDIVAFRFAYQQSGSFTVEGIGGVRISEKLWQEDFEDVDHIKHRRPGLVDHVETDGAGSERSVMAM